MSESVAAETVSSLRSDRIVVASWATNLLFAVTAVPVALGVDALEGTAIGVAVALFAVALGVWVYAFGLAVVRSARGDDIQVGNLWFLQGSAPSSVKRSLFWSLGVCLALTALTAKAEPFGVLVPMLALGFPALWGARHGVFPARVMPDHEDPAAHRVRPDRSAPRKAHAPGSAASPHYRRKPASSSGSGSASPRAGAARGHDAGYAGAETGTFAVPESGAGPTRPTRPSARETNTERSRRRG